MRPTHNRELNETHPLFPSGQWAGFYTYTYGPGTRRHDMSFVLNFQNGIVEGSGIDDIGPLRWHGAYDKEKLVCKMTKYYMTHKIIYEGSVDENGIWGTWKFGKYGFNGGGFHIWPKMIQEKSIAEQPEKIDETQDAVKTDFKSGMG